MQVTPPRVPAHVRPLLDALLEPQVCGRFEPTTWDCTIRMARRARLLGTLGARVARVLAFHAIDPSVQRHLEAGQVEADFRRQKTLHLLASIATHYQAPQIPCVLLKGAAYIAQDLALAQGRLPSDVDVMVPRASLDAVEASLLSQGWEYEEMDAYDQRYYRDWSHELPPLRLAGQSLELDLHHCILPPLGRLKPNTEALFQAARRVPNSPFSVLFPADQILLAAAHLFQDSDCTDRLRDLVDIDALLREFSASDGALWSRLLERAQLHNLGRPLWYALQFSRAWLATPVPVDALGAFNRFRPPLLAATVMQAFIARTLAPVDPDQEVSWRSRSASSLLLARATWLRMPPRLVAHHFTHKLKRSFAKPETKSAGQDAG
jgi:hypothetical protein